MTPRMIGLHVVFFLSFLAGWTPAPLGTASDRVLVLVDSSVRRPLEPGLERYFADVRGRFDVEFRVVSDGFYRMKPEEIRARLRREYGPPDGPLVGAILVGPIPAALKGGPQGPVYPAPLYYEDFDAEWIDADGDGVFEEIRTDRSTNPTEIWTAWWVPPSNDPAGQVRLLQGFLEKLHRHYTGESRGRNGAVFIAGNGNSVEITEAWTVLLDEALQRAGQGVARVYSRYGEMKEAVLPDPGPEFTADDFLAMLTGSRWQHVHTLTHGSPSGFYWSNGGRGVAITTDTIDFSRFDRTGPVIFTTSGCSNGVFRGGLGRSFDFARSIGNRLLFSPRTLTIVFYGSASPQSAGVFAGFHTPLVEALVPEDGGYIAEGYFRMRNTDVTWGLQHFIFRGVDEKILNGDPFARYDRADRP